MNFIARRIDRLLSKVELTKPTYILPMDGGICSQMNWYLMGHFLSTQCHYPVEFDISWFKVSGKDMNGNDVRNFDLLKAFPHLPIKISSRLVCFLYRHFFSYQRHFLDHFWENTPPIFLQGYYAPTYLNANYDNNTIRSIFSFNPEESLDKDNLGIYKSIPPKGSVAIHVRRGDLAENDLPFYGKAVSIEYFLEAIKFLSINEHATKFYFFSDDKNYVYDSLIPKLPQDVRYSVIENGSDKGYFDLFLISRCQHQITSKGSLGKWGAVLSNAKDKVIIVEKDDPNTWVLAFASAKIVRL